MIEWIAMLYLTAVAVMRSGVVVFLGFLVYLALSGDYWTRNSNFPICLAQKKRKPFWTPFFVTHIL